MWNKIKQIFTQPKEKPYLIDYVIYQATLSLNVKLENYYNDSDQDFAFIIEDDSDLPVVIEGFMSAARTSTIDNYIRNQYKQLKTDDDVGILVYDDAESVSKKVYRMDEPIAQRIINRLGDNVWHPKVDSKTELYKTHRTMLQLQEYIPQIGILQKSKYENHEDYTGVFEPFIHDQDFTDYLVKVDLISNDQSLFDALTKEDDETIKKFFDIFNQ